MIDWSNPKEKISNHFSVNEALFLPKWGRLATEKDGLTDNSKIALIALFTKLDKVRDLLNAPLIVHVAFRSVSYNVLVDGADNSAHIARLVLVDGGKNYIAAVDFHPLVEGATQGDKCDNARKTIEPELESLGLRMENNPKGSSWIHLDNRPIPKGGNRVFNI